MIISRVVIKNKFIDTKEETKSIFFTKTINVNIFPKAKSINKALLYYIVLPSNPIHL